MNIVLRSFLLLVIVSVCSFAQDFNLTGAGARAEGFGGAFIGLTDDATAVVWNPAGLTQLERPEASVVTRFIHESASFKYTPDPSLNSDESQGHFSLNFGSFATPVTKGENKIVIALAIQRQLDFYGNRINQYDDQSGFFVDKITEKFITKGGVNTITPGIGVKINPIFSVGFSANIWMGTLNAEQSQENSRLGKDRFTFDLDYSGLNFVLGGLVDFEAQNNLPLKFGVTLRTPFTLKGSGTWEMNYRLTANQDANGDLKHEIEMPFMLGFGSSFRFGENFTVAADFEMRNYGSKQNKVDVTLPDGSISSSLDNISESKQNLNEFRIGGEYLVVMEKAVIPLRFGFKTVPTVLADYIVDTSTGEYVPSTTQVTGKSLSFGSGFITDAFAFDVTYSRTTYTQKYDVDGQIDYTTGTLSTSVIFYF